VSLRKVINHPFHLSQPRSGVAVEQDLPRVSGKFEFLDRILPRLQQFKHKILIFSQMSSSLDLLELLLKTLELRYARIDGRMNIRLICRRWTVHIVLARSVVFWW